MAFERYVHETLLSQLVIHDEFEARYWARVLGLSRAELREAFGLVEPSALDTGGLTPPWERRIPSMEKRS